MTDQQKNVPYRRFKEFENANAWEQRKLYEIAETTYGGGTPKTSISDYWNGKIPWVQSKDILENNVLNVAPRKYISNEAVQNSATKLIPANSIAIVTRVGVGKLAIMPYQYATSQDFLSLSNLKVDTLFAVYNLYKRLQRDSNFVQGTSIKGITKNELLNKKVMVPVEINEQSKIGCFFERLDHLITLHQRKYDKLKSLKSGYLTEMFPAEGERKPKRRFSGFTDDWEQRKTKELCDISTGKGNTQDKVKDGKYPFYVRSATIERSNEYLYDQEAVLTVGDGVGTGKVFHYVNGKYNLHQRVYRMFNFNHGVSAKYFYHYFSKNFYRRVMSMTAKTSVDSVRMEMIADMKIKFPSPAEQETIVAVLDGVDDLISLHQQQLEKLKNFKQAYLNEMFV